MIKVFCCRVMYMASHVHRSRMNGKRTRFRFRSLERKRKRDQFRNERKKRKRLSNFHPVSPFIRRFARFAVPARFLTFEKPVLFPPLENMVK